MDVVVRTCALWDLEMLSRARAPCARLPCLPVAPSGAATCASISSLTLAPPRPASSAHSTPIGEAHARRLVRPVRQSESVLRLRSTVFSSSERVTLRWLCILYNPCSTRHTPLALARFCATGPSERSSPPTRDRRRLRLAGRSRLAASSPREPTLPRALRPFHPPQSKERC